MKILLIIVVILLILAGLWKFNTASRLYTIDAPLPEDFPATGFSHQAFEKLLQRFVDEQGNVGYQAWKDSPNGELNLSRYLAAVAQFSPDSHPQRFASEQHTLAYWIYSYNALVIHSILANWPLESVTNLKAPFEIIKGFGFFYNQKFIIGGKPYNLYQLEQQKMVHAKADPRLHFVLNCASTSCPPMRPQLPVGVELEPFLQQAAIDFINNPDNVVVDPDCNTISISKIFDWYKDDFIRQSELTAGAAGENKNSKSESLIQYITGFAAPQLQNKLASCDALQLDYIEYDWSINKSAL
ncbi:MAG: hypothetical protein ACI8WB_002741 [Phenylobacterium sp.]|jgi:hypothetical protein